MVSRKNITIKTRTGRIDCMASPEYTNQTKMDHEIIASFNAINSMKTTNTFLLKN